MVVFGQRIFYYKIIDYNLYVHLILKFKLYVSTTYLKKIVNIIN